MVVWFIQERLRRDLYTSDSFGFAWAHLCAPKVSLVLLWIAWVYSGASRGRPVHSGSRQFTWARVGIVGIILFLVGSVGRIMVSSGSFGFTWVNLGASRCRRVHSGSFGFTGARLMFVGFIRVRVGSLGDFKGSLHSFVFAWVHWGASRGCRVHSSSRGFTRARLRSRWDHLSSRGLIHTKKSVAWLFRARVGSLGPPWFRRVHSDSRVLMFARLGVIWFIWVCVGSLGGA